jgi:hypothetical protein
MVQRQQRPGIPKVFGLEYLLEGVVRVCAILYLQRAGSVCSPNHTTATRPLLAAPIARHVLSFHVPRFRMTSW